MDPRELTFSDGPSISASVDGGAMDPRELTFSDGPSISVSVDGGVIWIPES